MYKRELSWLSLLLLTATAAVAAQRTWEPAKSEPKLMLTSRAFLDQSLHARDGSALGSLSQILTDAETGQIRFVTVDLAERTVAVPWHQLRVGDEGRLHLEVPAAELLSSPSVDRSKLNAATTRGVPLDARAMTKLRGVVEKASLGVTALSEEGDPLVTVLMATDDLRVQILMAPQSYLDQKSLPLDEGEWIEVVGVQAIISGEPTLIAYGVTLAEETIRLRRADGTPLWKTTGGGS